MAKPRQFKKLAKLKGSSFYEAIAEGISLTGRHVGTMSAAIETLTDQEHFVAAEMLEVLAKEEIGKFLILVDAARIGRDADSGGQLTNGASTGPSVGSSRKGLVLHRNRRKPGFDPRGP